MFTRLIQYVLRLFSAGLIVTVAAVLFGPQAAVAASLIVRGTKADDDKNHLNTAAIHTIRSAPAKLTDTMQAKLPTLAPLNAFTKKPVTKNINLVTPTPTPPPTLAATPTRAEESSAPAVHTATPASQPTSSHTSTPTHSASAEPTHTATITPTHTATPTPKPRPTVTTVTVSSKIAAMLGFARAQLGEPYASPGNSSSTWDCSGLTQKAFAAIGINIGTHSATNQFNTAKARGLLVPYSQKRAGDQIFYGVLGNMYHTTIYSGNGQMIEAADWGKPVRERAIWGVPYPYVARWIR